MLTSVLCVCVVTNILHEGLHIVSFYLGCCTSNYNLPATLPPGEGIAAFGVPATPGGVALRGNPMRNPALLVIHKKLSILFVQTVLYYHQRAPGMG